MKRKKKLQEIAEIIDNMKITKNIDLKIIRGLQEDLDEEEKIARNYLQITQNGMLLNNKKRAVLWNKKVMDLKKELNDITK